jgi:exopolysaccharide production protein ExoQ
VTPAKEKPAALIRLYAVGVLFLGTGAFFVVFGPGATGEPQPAVLALWVLVYAVAAVALLDGMLRARRAVPTPPELMLFIGLAVASTFWSEAAVLTARRSFGLVGTVLVALLLAQRLRPLELLNALRQAMVLLASFSLVLYVLRVPAVVDDTHGTLRGVVATKNSLGFFMALGLLACAAHYVLEPRNRRRVVASAGLFGITLSLTDSKSAILISIAVAGVTLAVLLGRRRHGTGLLVAGGCLVLAVATFILPNASMEGAARLIGEDTTLTGRDAVWEESLAAAEAHQFLGYGYGAFWQGTDAAARIQGRLLWEVPTAHNGVLEVLLDLGYVGVLASLLVVLGLLARGVRDWQCGRRRAAALRLPLLVLLVFSNIVESNFLVQNSLLALLIVSALAMPARADDDGEPDTETPHVVPRHLVPAARLVAARPGRLADTAPAGSA